MELKRAIRNNRLLLQRCTSALEKAAGADASACV
jgi:hypothetical protein